MGGGGRDRGEGQKYPEVCSPRPECVCEFSDFGCGFENFGMWNCLCFGDDWVGLCGTVCVCVWYVFLTVGSLLTLLSSLSLSRALFVVLSLSLVVQEEDEEEKD